ncbi:Uncharacterised protein [Mycobacterium tuberculosis]|nr:Uncharacterised protein [Mycobacterium tuberculosis]
MTDRFLFLVQLAFQRIVAGQRVNTRIPDSVLQQVVFNMVHNPLQLFG